MFFVGWNWFGVDALGFVFFVFAFVVLWVLPGLVCWL